MGYFKVFKIGVRTFRREKQVMLQKPSLVVGGPTWDSAL
jgi:hypothetical protein